MICVSFWDLRRCCPTAATWMRCHASQPITAGSTRVVSSPLPETSLLARSCNKAERERYSVFGESLPSRFSRSSTCVCRKLDSAILMVKAEGQVVRRRRRGAQPRDGEERPCSEIDGSSTHYNRRHIRVGSCVTKRSRSKRLRATL